MVATYAKKLGLHFGEELPTERKLGNFVNHYAVSVKKDSSDFPQDFLKTCLEVILLDM